MRALPNRTSLLPWLWAVAGGWLLLLLAAAPPWLGTEVGSALMAGFSLVCHQLPERSFHVHGGQLALCHRCFGIAVGLVVGLTFVAPAMSSAARTKLSAGRRPGVWLMLAAVPAAVDWLVGIVGIWTNTPISRFATGALFGLVAGMLLATGVMTSRRGAVPAFNAKLPPLTYHPT